MNMKLIAALNRRRLRRRLLIEGARLEEMKENAAALLEMQRKRVEDAEKALDAAIGSTSADIARRMDLECKAGLLA